MTAGARLLSLLFVAVLAGAQPRPAPPAAFGRVTEPGDARGLAGVRVTIERYESEEPSSFTPRTAVAALETDAAGGFRFAAPTAGLYRVTVAKEGYAAPGGTLDPGRRTTVNWRIEADHSAAPLHFELARPAAIRGRLFDRDTEQPVAGHRVAAMQFGYVRGRAWVMPGDTATTGPDGSFEISGLSPTRYVLALEPAQSESAATRYALVYWPGAGALGEAAPLPVGSGVRFDTGRIWIAKTPHYPVRVAITGEPCAAGERLAFSASADRLPLQIRRLATVACGEEVVLSGFARGDHLLEVASSIGRRGAVTFAVHGEDAAVTVALSRGVGLTGRFTVPEGHEAPAFDGVRVTLHPVFGSTENDQARPGAGGEFRIENVRPREFEVSIAGVPTTHYVRRIRYNDLPVAGRRVTVAAQDSAARMEIELSGRPAVVEGTVTDDRRRPVAEAAVLLFDGATVGADGYLPFRAVAADGRGRYRFPGLAPGAYRVLAIPASAQAGMEAPYAVTALIGDAERTEAAEGQTVMIPLRLRTPRAEVP